MPGRLIMDQQGAIGSHDLKKDRAQAQQTNLPSKPDAAQKQTAPPVSAPEKHAANGLLPNGASSNGQHPPATNGDITGSMTALSDPRSPPPLDQSWREWEGNKSMGTLIQRLAQSCFDDLNTALTKMAETPTDSRMGQANGVTPQSSDTSESSLSKKRTFMEFANGQRDRFIKTLVLSDWAKNGEDMNKLVDLKVMFDDRDGRTKHAINFIGRVKHDVNPVKIPNPNIDLAMELLATGKAAKTPHLGYILPKKLAAKEILKTMRNMNVMLETRLNLHEDLPPHFNDFTVANGKATFRVPGEFEVDLSIADDDVTSPFYFIDVRFSFSPSSSEISEQLRQHLEPVINGVLVLKGLQGCYDYLHNFVLTYKINTLYDQAMDIERKTWFGCVGIQKSRRVLTIQYWREVPGRKNWIEIAVSTGKRPGRRSRRPPTPELSVRWFRQGEVVQDHGLEFDWQDLSVERILRTVIAKHISLALDATRERLRTLAKANSKLAMELHCTDGSPEDACLKLSLPGMQTPLKVKLETVTGHISLSPATQRSADLEGRLNKQPDAGIASAVAGLLCNTLKDCLDKAAELAGWSLFREPIRTDNFKALFGADIPSWRAFVPSPAWVSEGSQWVIFPTFSLAGQKWFVARLENRTGPSQNASAKAIIVAREVDVQNIAASDSTTPMSRNLLLKIEKLAVAEVSFAVLSEQLSSEHIPHRMQKTTSLTSGNISINSDTTVRSTMLIEAKGGLKTPTGSVALSIRIINQGFVTQESGGDGEEAIVHELRLSLPDGHFKHLRDYLTKSRRGADIAMSASGGFALRLRTSFGQPFYQQIQKRINSCLRLDHCLGALNDLKMKPLVMEPAKISFIYSEAPELRAQFDYREVDGKPKASVKLEPTESNPHRRLRVELERMYNSSGAAGNFRVLCLFLKYSLPAMQFVEKLLATDPGAKQVSITHRSASKHQLSYKSPLPEWTFLAELKFYDGDNGSRMIVWKIQPDPQRTAKDLASSAFGGALLDFVKQKNDHWKGLEDGTLVVKPEAGAIALEALDRLVRNFKGRDDNATKKDEGKSAPQQSASTQQKAPGNSTAPKQAAPPRANGNANSNSARNNQSKVKKEVIELD